jgi:hypothetical protein
MKWKIMVAVMPYSTGRGADVDRKAVGPREQSTVVECDSINDAMRFAETFTRGVKTNPDVWECPIHAIERIGS